MHASKPPDAVVSEREVAARYGIGAAPAVTQVNRVAYDQPRDSRMASISWAKSSCSSVGTVVGWEGISPAASRRRNGAISDSGGGSCSICERADSSLGL